MGCVGAGVMISVSHLQGEGAPYFVNVLFPSETHPPEPLISCFILARNGEVRHRAAAILTEDILQCKCIARLLEKTEFSRRQQLA